MQLKATVKALSMIESHEAAAKRRGVRACKPNAPRPSSARCPLP